MQMRRSVTQSRASRWLVIAIVVVAALCVWMWRARHPRDLVTAANALDYRVVEARLSGGFENRPLRTGSRALPLQRGARSGRVGAGLLLAGRIDKATMVLRDELHRTTGESDVLAAISHCRDVPLLVDFSAAAVQSAAAHDDARELLVAFEAADRAWQLAHTAEAAWNRALAAGRFGLSPLAARAWNDAATLESTSGWGREAKLRREAAIRRASTPPEESLELFFHRDLIERSIVSLSGAMAKERREVRRIGRDAPGDHLAGDTAASLLRLRQDDRQRAVAALASYTRGRTAFEHDHLDEARIAFAAAEMDLGAMRIPLALLARDQRIRSECSQAHPDCLASIRAFSEDLAAAGRYPWLSARAAYAEGQTLYRRGRIYDAATWLGRARDGFAQLHDTASEGVMHSLLANVFSAAGETDIALRHYVAAIRMQSPQMGDRRRRQLEDAMMFLLRHGFLASAEALLGELSATPATESARVIESTLRGILYARRGNVDRASANFERARTLLGTVDDEAIRAEVGMILTIAEAGSCVNPPHPIVEQIDAAIAEHQGADQAIWLPQLLAERGTALERRNDFDAAERDYLRAIEILEQRAPQIDQVIIGFGVATDSESPFDRAIRLLLRQGRLVEALSIAERAAALRISSLYASSVGLRDVYLAARKSVTTDVVTDMRRALEHDQAAVVYHFLRDQLITWVVTRDRVFAVRRRVPLSDLISCVQRLRGGCTTDAASDLLLRDWIEHVPRGTTLLVQPPAELQAVPFSMLKTRGGEHLLARNPIATAPSLRAFVDALHADEQRAGACCESFFAAAPQPGGDLPPLPLVRNEVLLASQSYVRPLVDSRATRAQFVEHTRSYAIVHFAGHVLVNDEQPLLSALVFNGSELLYVHELAGKSFARARLVVLSGCETGRAPRPTMSVAAALLSQGVPSVVYTLWPVSDDVAQAFAIAFHRAIAAGAARADAVRTAQLSLFRIYPNRPEAWAAFALAGTPGVVVGKREMPGPLMTKGEGR